MIVEHYTVTSTFQQTFNTFAPDTPDAELGELPGTCAHFVIDKDGTIYQLVPRSIMCRHTVGLNYTSIGIEHVGSSDSQVLDNAKQMAASLRLTRWLRCRYSIDVKNVIGHAESLSSPYHKERVERLKNADPRRHDRGRDAHLPLQAGAKGLLLSTVGQCESSRRLLSSWRSSRWTPRTRRPRPSPG